MQIISETSSRRLFKASPYFVEVIMIGRKQELDLLEKLYTSPSFQFLIMYGRRRVGKTTILQKFAQTHDCIFFPAQEKNDALNREDFSRTVQEYYTDDYIAPFPDWEKALSFIDKHSGPDRRTVLIIDEFPFLTEQNPSIKSIFQHTIDHSWQNKNIFLIFCGSSVSFMINEIMGYKSPLYGRITSHLEVRPFDYLESAAFFPDYSQEEKLLAYGILGGIPRYLRAFNPSQSITENIAGHILSENSYLHDEPQLLLRMKLREPGIYNSILEAIANGTNKVTAISDRIHEDRSKCTKYLQVLQNIRLVKKIIPCDQPSTSKKGIYTIADHYYRFWYRYTFSQKSYYFLLGERKAAQEIMDGISDYMGPVFEEICTEYLWRQAKNHALPFIPAAIGKWWGTNPIRKQQDDIDILALDKTGKEGLFCECKFRNRPMPMEEYDDLVQAAAAFPNVTQKHFCFFSKGGYTHPVIDRANREGTRLLGIKELFEIQ